jgi:hypothetical protein
MCGLLMASSGSRRGRSELDEDPSAVPHEGPSGPIAIWIVSERAVVLLVAGVRWSSFH